MLSPPRLRSSARPARRPCAPVRPPLLIAPPALPTPTALAVAEAAAAAAGAFAELQVRSRPRPDEAPAARARRRRRDDALVSQWLVDQGGIGAGPHA